MKRSLDEDGKSIYVLGSLSNTKDVSIALKLSLYSHNNHLEDKVSLFEYLPIYRQAETSYESYDYQGVRLVQINSFCRLSPEDQGIERMLEEAKEVSKLDRLIIDLRGNTGGSMINIEKWYQAFTGKKLEKDIVQSGLYTDTSIEMSKNKFQSRENESEEIKSLCLDTIDAYEESNYYPGWSPVKFGSFKPIENNTDILILVDKDTSSAAEFFLHYMRKLDRVNVIGTLTNGCVLTGNCNAAYLPNSNLRLNISHKIYMSEDLNCIDGLGLMPDYWVKPEKALDRAVQFLKQK